VAPHAPIKVVATSVHRLQDSPQWGAGQPIGASRNQFPKPWFMPPSDRLQPFTFGASGKAGGCNEGTTVATELNAARFSSSETQKDPAALLHRIS